VEAAVNEQRLAGVLGMVGLDDRRDDLVGTFSGGMKRRPGSEKLLA
jgi:ABC-type multidrug transport system ATPase subunit